MPPAYFSAGSHVELLRSQCPVNDQLKLASRLRIVAWEVVFIGAFLLAIVLLQLEEAGPSSTGGSFAWVYGIIGVTLILVGLEGVSLVRHMPKEG
jgi:hypothetical protein